MLLCGTRKNESWKMQGNTIGNVQLFAGLPDLLERLHPPRVCRWVGLGKEARAKERRAVTFAGLLRPLLHERPQAGHPPPPRAVRAHLKMDVTIPAQTNVTTDPIDNTEPPALE